MKFLAITLIVHRPDPITGVQKSTHERFREVLDNALLAEELGFDGFGVGERHERPFISSSPTVVLSHIAALTRRSCSNAVNASPAYTAGGATTNAAPDPTAHNQSKSDASKVGAATINTRASAPNPYTARCAAANPSKPAWLTATPFGAPVDPEVNIT